MPAITCSERDQVAREATSETTTFAHGALAVRLAREYVRDASPEQLPAERVADLVLLTSELVTNAVQNSDAGPIRLAVVGGATFTRIEVGNPRQTWARAPEAGSLEPDQLRGRGLFLVDQLSERWGTDDGDCTVWFEFDHPAPAPDVWVVLERASYPATREELVGEALAAGMSPSIVARLEALKPERFENAEAVSEEWVAARAESANSVTSEFERFDESAARQAVCDDLRTAGDRRSASMDRDGDDERRRPSERRGRHGDKG
jgi:anti-sigma regulatory factor (Ser/Thr protein kinase)